VAFLILGVFFIFLGITGFSPQGLLFSSKRRLAGKSGRRLGMLCVFIGIVLVASAFTVSSEAKRPQVVLVGWGIVIGSGLTWLTFREW
jgi:4-amino-4-deoxy-L-arabinose transferase-like glycosyltransferase